LDFNKTCENAVEVSMEYTIKDDELMVAHARLLEDFELREKEHKGLKGELP
jgi:hypothetical protein